MITDSLSIEEKKLLTTLNFSKNEVLFYEHDECDFLGIVIEGVIKISSMTFEGNEIVYNVLNKGDIFGSNLLFSKDNKFRGDVRGVTNGKCYIIKKHNLLKILRNNEDFLTKYLTFNSDFTKNLNAKIKLLSFINAKERFLYYLFINNNNIHIKSVTSLAQELYLTRETTSRLITSLIKKGKIVKKNNEIMTNDSFF